MSNLLSAPALRPSTRFVLGAGGDYQELIQTDELVTVDRPWEITLDLPAWTRRRDRIRAVARPDN